jgi:hypothetical protein
MSNVADATRVAQDKILEGVRQSQKAVVDAVDAWAQTVQKIVPAIPTVPGSEQLPKPQELVDGAFEFAQKLLDAQREFAKNVLEAAAPVIEGKSGPTP